MIFKIIIKMHNHVIFQNYIIAIIVLHDPYRNNCFQIIIIQYYV